MSKIKCPLHLKPEAQCLAKQKGDTRWNQHGRNDYMENYCSTMYYLDCIDFREYIKNVSVQKGKVLIVDDEKSFVRIIQRFFSELGYSLLTATDGNTAMEYVKDENPVIVLLDMNLPNVNGIEVLRFLNETSPNTKVVVITGYKEHYAQQLKELKIDALFDKPIRLEALKKYIEELLAEDVLGKIEQRSIEKGEETSTKANILFFVREEIEVQQIAKHNLVYECLRKEFERKKHLGDEYRLEKASTESDLFEKLQNFKPDIVLVDYEDAQDTDFGSVIQKMRESKFRPHEIITISFRGYLSGQNIGDEKILAEDQCLRAITKLFDQIRLVAYQYKLTKE